MGGIVAAALPTSTLIAFCGNALEPFPTLMFKPMLFAFPLSVTPLGARLKNRVELLTIFVVRFANLNQTLAVKSPTVPSVARVVLLLATAKACTPLLPEIGLCDRFNENPWFCTPEFAAPWRSKGAPLLMRFRTTGSAPL